MKKTFLHIFFFSLAVLSVSGWTVRPVSAATESQPVIQSITDNASLLQQGADLVITPPAAPHTIKAGTIITLNPLKDTNLGDTFTLSGIINDWSGRPVSGKSIIFKINEAYLGQTNTNANGVFQQIIKKNLDAGEYEITATFSGTHDLSYTSASTTLKILPADIQVQTVPAIAGVTFQLGGVQFVTGDDGSADLKVDKAGQYRLEILPDLYSDPSQRIEFGRWEDESSQPFQDIQVPAKKIYQAGLNVYYQVGESFVGLDGHPVDPKRITEFIIRNGQGDSFTLNNGEAQWIPVSRTIRGVNGLQTTKLLYSVISVMVDGSNVVNQSQQQFYAKPNDSWKISLLFYSLRVTILDGLFGTAVGKSINLVFPDGQVRNYPVDKAGTAEIHSLARGIYSIQVIGVKGMGNSTPVALSKNQEITMKILTYLDLAIVGSLGTLLALGLLLYGRRRAMLSLLKNKKRAFQGSGTALTQADEIRPTVSRGDLPNDGILKRF